MNINDTKEHEQLLTAREVAALLPDTSYQTVLRWARDGELPFIELPGGRKYFCKSDIDAILTPRFSTDDCDPLPEDQELPGFVLAGGDSGEC